MVIVPPIDDGSGGIIYTGEDGVHIHDTVISLNEATVVLIDNAIQESRLGQPLGVPQLDVSSALSALVRVRYITAAQADAYTPKDGELLITSDTKELRYGDNQKAGGFLAGLNAKNMLYVAANGTAIENGAALVAAYNIARTASPNGAAKSATNRMYVLIGCGSFDCDDLFIMDTPFIDIIGLDMIGCRVNFGGTVLRIEAACTDHSFKNITFYKDGTTHGIQWVFTDVPVKVYWENLRFEGISTDTVITSFSRIGGSSSSFNGTVRNVKTACDRLISGGTGLAFHTVNLNFEDCESGNRPFAPAVTSSRFIYAGIMRNCVWNNTTNIHFDQLATARFYNTKFGMPVNYCVTGVRFEYCRFVPAAGVASLKGVSATQNVFIAHSQLSLTGIDATISNTAGATPCNTFSDS